MQGYDPATGKLVWTCNTLLRTMMTSPVEKAGVIAVPGYGDSARTLKFALMEWLDTNQDAKLARSEVLRVHGAVRSGPTRTRTASLAAMKSTAFQHPSNMVGGRIVQAIKGGGVGDVTKTHLLWNSNSKAPVEPVVDPGLRQPRLHGEGRRPASCFDAAKGKPLWNSSVSTTSATTTPRRLPPTARCTSPAATASWSCSKTARRCACSPPTTPNGEILATPAMRTAGCTFGRRNGCIVWGIEAAAKPRDGRP